MMDALTASNILCLEKNSKETSVKDWDKMNKTAYDIIRSYLTQNIMYHVMIDTSAGKIWEILESKYLTKSDENCLHLKRTPYRIQFK